MINRSNSTIKQAIFACLVLTSAAVFAFYPWYSILAKVYLWHLEQPEVIDGSIELAVVYLLWLLTARFIRHPGHGVRLISLVAALYLQRHAMLLSLLMIWLYLEILIACGCWLLRKLGYPVLENDVLRGQMQAFVVGMASWTLLALVLSALGLGSPGYLRLLTLALGLGVFVTSRPTPITQSMYNAYRSFTFSERSLALALALLILAQCGKAPLGIDYDSLWYGLRPDKVLFGAGGLFDTLHLTHFVYYYPKQLELFLGPLSGLGEYGLIQAGNIGFLTLAIMVIALLFRDQGIGIRDALLWTLLVISIPCFSNMASTAKPDTLSVLSALFVALFGLGFIRSRNLFELGLMVASIALLLGTKLTAVAYVPALLAGFIAAFFTATRSQREGVSYWRWLWTEFVKNPASARLAARVVALLGLGTYLILLARTWYLTGIPTLPVGIELWKSFGLEPKYPWSYMTLELFSSARPDLSEQIGLGMQMLFDPGQHGHYVMAWPGNAAVYLGLLLITLRLAGAIRFKPVLPIIAFFTPVLLTAVAVTFTISRHEDGSIDGNYFLIPVSFGIIASGLMLSRLGDIWNRRLVALVGLMFILSHLPIMFVSHWSWHAGTSAFQANLTHWMPGGRKQDEADLRVAGVSEIDAYVVRHQRLGLCVGLSRNDKGSSEFILRRLSCRYEDFEQLIGPMFELFSTEERFADYLAWARPELLIVPRSEFRSTTPKSPSILATFDRLSEATFVTRVESPEYIALDLSAYWSNASQDLER